MLRMPNEPPSAIKPADALASARQHGELVKRGVSGALLGGLALTAVWLGSPTFMLVVMAIGIVMSWEWGRVVRGRDFDPTLIAHALGVAVATALADKSHIGWALAVLVVSGVIVFVRQTAERPWLSAVGLAYVGLPAMALVWLRAEPDHGLWAVAFVFATVWAHDTFAMLVGKAIGGPRLWPSLSPNKTWAGFAGGILAAAAIGWAANAAIGGTHSFGLTIIGCALGLSAFVGDLVESGLKRRYGMKNASGLIPGHGGFLDRMDGLVTASITAVGVALLLNSARPADGLLLLQ
jgi:phosphatidate cytidylyltransferase